MPVQLKAAQIHASRRESLSASSTTVMDNSRSETISNGESASSVMSSDASEAGDFMSVTEEGSVLEAMIEATLCTDDDGEGGSDFWTSLLKGELITDPAQAFTRLNDSNNVDASSGLSYRKSPY